MLTKSKRPPLAIENVLVRRDYEDKRGAKSEKAGRTLSTGFERSRIWRNPCGGGARVAVNGCQFGDSHAAEIHHVTHRPEIVHQEIEYTEDDHEHHGAELGLEPHHHHHTGHEAEQADNDPAEPPVPGKDESNEQKDQQHPSRELEVHLAVLLIHLRQPGGRELLPHPAVGQHHQETTHDAEVAEEEIQVEDETVAESLGDDDAEETEDGVFAVLAGDDKGGTGDHGEDVDKEEEMCETPWYYSTR